MLCPIDQSNLVKTERQGVEIDYCPTCRGVWLDRGELDKIIERANEADGTTDAGVSGAGAAAGSAAKGSFTTPRVGDMQGRVQPLDAEGEPEQLVTTRRDEDADESYDWEEKKRKKTKRRSFFEELFDFD